MDQRLGNRPPDLRVSDEIRRLFDTPELQASFLNVSADTNPRNSAIEYKQGVATEIKREGLVDQEVLKKYPTVYIGSSTDIEYPLLLGAREIQMVDPIFADPAAVLEVRRKIKNLLGAESSQEQQLIFKFNFGNGPELVRVRLDPSVYGPVNRIPKPTRFKSPKQIGMIIGFRTYGTGFEVEPEAVQNLVKGGYVLMDEAQNSFISSVSDVERAEYMVRDAPKSAIDLMQKKYAEKGYQFIPLKSLTDSYHYTFLKKL